MHKKNYMHRDLKPKIYCVITKQSKSPISVLQKNVMRNLLLQIMLVQDGTELQKFC